MNPILSQLNGTKLNQSFQMINQIKQMMSGRNPNEVMQNLMNTNPTFRNFVEHNRGKSPEEIANSYGVDLSLLNGLFK